MTRKRVRVIVNPAAGSGRRDAAEPALAEFRLTDWDFDVVTTDRPGSAAALAAGAVAHRFDLVIVAGGDGTVNEVLQPLAGSETALAVLPTGTANLLARECCLPLDIAAAGREVAAGTERIVDVGLAGRRYFLLFAGIGYDAAVVQRVDPRLKRLVGPLSFVAAATTVAPGYRGARASVELDNAQHRRHVLMMVIANTRLFGLMPLARAARADDGLLDVWVFHGAGVLTKARHLIAVLTGWHRPGPDVDQAQARDILVRSRTPLPVEVDGELAGWTPMRFRVVPSALRLWLPPSAAGVFGPARPRTSARN